MSLDPGPEFAWIATADEQRVRQDLAHIVPESFAVKFSVWVAGITRKPGAFAQRIWRAIKEVRAQDQAAAQVLLNHVHEIIDLLTPHANLRAAAKTSLDQLVADDAS